MRSGRLAGAAISLVVLLFTGILVGGALAAPPQQRNFTAHLSGDQEVPPVDTEAQGQVKFQLSKDGSELSYTLITANIENVTMAHIHLAPAGQNGSVAAWLYPGGPPPQPIPGRSDGVLATGTITSDDLIGPLAGEDLSALIEIIDAAGAYVNVHTQQVGSGEIRGQIG